jgi:hypothetical protein
MREQAVMNLLILRSQQDDVEAGRAPRKQILFAVRYGWASL